MRTAAACETWGAELLATVYDHGRTRQILIPNLPAHASPSVCVTK